MCCSGVRDERAKGEIDGNRQTAELDQDQPPKSNYAIEKKDSGEKK